MAIQGVPAELQDAAMAMYVANLDFEENKGSMQNADKFWDIFVEKRNEYRAAKAAYEEKMMRAVSQPAPKKASRPKIRANRKH